MPCKQYSAIEVTQSRVQAGPGMPGLQMGHLVGVLLYSLDAGHGVKQAGG